MRGPCSGASDIFFIRTDNDGLANEHFDGKRANVETVHLRELLLRFGPEVTVVVDAFVDLEQIDRLRDRAAGRVFAVQNNFVVDVPTGDLHQNAQHVDGRTGTSLVKTLRKQLLAHTFSF
jgi:hypothetical protein